MVYKVLNAAGGWSDNSTPALVKHDATVRLRAIVKVTPVVDGQEYLWGADQGTATVAGQSRTAYKWADSVWGKAPPDGLGLTATIEWNTLTPYMRHEGDHGNDPHEGHEGYRWYTSVCPWDLNCFLGSNGVFSKHDQESGYLDIIEYHFPQDGAGGGWQITDDKSEGQGTRRYRIGECYTTGPGSGRSRTVYTAGKEDEGSYSKLVQSGADDAYDWGVKSTVMRIVRKSDFENSEFIRHIEAYTLVPWILGSGTHGMAQVPPGQHQTERYIGFDCADLVVGAARHAGLTTIDYTGANALQAERDPRGPYTDTYCLEGNVVKRVSDGENADITIGTGANDLHIGDLIFLDNYPADGTYDHTTVLYKDDGADAGLLDGGDTLIFAGYTDSDTEDGLFKETLSGEMGDDHECFVVREGW